MELKRYQAESMAEALEKVKKDLGRDAVILHTRTLRKGGVLGIGSRSLIEITASRDLNVLPPSERRAIIGRRGGQGSPSKGTETSGAQMDLPADSNPERPSSPQWSRRPVEASADHLRTANQERAVASDDLTVPIGSSREPELYTPFTQPRSAADVRTPRTSSNVQRPPRESLANPLKSEPSREMVAFTSSMEREMSELRLMVRQLLSRSESNRSPRPVIAPDNVPGDLQEVYTDLIQNEVAEEIACDIIAQAQQRLEAARTALRLRNEKRKAEAEDKAKSVAEADAATADASTDPAAPSSTTAGRRKRTTRKKVTKGQEQSKPEAGPADILKKGISEQQALREIVPVVLQEVIEQMIPDAGPVELGRGERTRCVALTGPTGVGKTTTIAKLAAHFKLREGKSVGLITIDTYRIAAIDQLRAYAEILSVPLEVVLTPDDMVDALKRMQRFDLVLIDTSGRSQRDTQRLSELHTFLEVARKTIAEFGGRLETHLVLSAIAHPQQLAQVTERFSALGLDRVVFTKLDEAVGLGVILNTIRKLNLKLSYLTTGQDVPDHLEIGHRRRIAELVLKGFPEESPREPALQPAGSVDDIA